ncbi:aspartate aminotransferase family protein [Streptomyces sp. NPDC006134]|uniref:aspartate aminotransferase family protein n=1 Tax=Streptomyces sp. NPDC006134 TaxID=3154467 RepID=UPI0033EB0CAF
MSDLFTRHQAVMPAWVSPYYEQPLEILSGKGCRVFDADGKSYLDFFGGILTNMLGYDVQEVREAVERQLSTGIVHTSTLYLIRSQVELAEKITKLSGLPDAKVFFTNSGTEANETALLLATHARGSDQVLALRNSYHGRSYGASAVTGNRRWKNSSLSPLNVHYLHGTDRESFPWLTDEAYARFCVEDLRDCLDTALASDVACLIAEPIQGVGGFTAVPDGLFKDFKEVLDDRGILLISDEVQTGWGRTGESFWGIQAHGVTPDAMTFAKGLGNGFAIGGVVARGELLDSLPAQGISTFGGNPLSTTAANATLDYLLSHHLQAHVHRLGTKMIAALRTAAERLPMVSAVRGKGFMFAIDLIEPATGKHSPTAAATVLEETRRRGLLVGKGGLHGSTLRMAPPLTLDDEEADEGMTILIDALDAVERERLAPSDRTGSRRHSA